MILIIFGVLAFGGFIAFAATYPNSNGSCFVGKGNSKAKVIYLPTDIEKEKRRRQIKI